MPGGFHRMFKQDVTFWQPTSTGVDRDGNTTWRRGVQIKGRWEDKIEQAQNANGEEVMSKAVVYLPGTQTIEEDWRMALGCIADSDPDTLPKGYRVIAVGDSPQIRNKRSFKKIWLA